MAGYFSDAKKGTFAIRGDISTNFTLEPDRPGSAPVKVIKEPSKIPVAKAQTVAVSAPAKVKTQKALPPKLEPTKSLKPTKTSIEWTKLTIPELKEEIRRRNTEEGKRITITGNKTELIERLVADDNSSIVRAVNNGDIKRSYEEWISLRLDQLRDIARERKENGRKINVTGSKPELIERLMQDDRMKGGTRKNMVSFLNNKTRKYMKNPL
jgi:hypothetical protein